MWGVSIASEGNMRKRAKHIVGENLAAEYVPMTFSLKEGGEEVKPAPYSYIPDLWEKIETTIYENERYYPAQQKSNH